MTLTDARNYSDQHNILRRERGRAADYACIDCGHDALHWSYDRTDHSAEVLEWSWGMVGWRIWSRDLDQYVPRCRKCHWRHDHPEGGRPRRRTPESTAAERANLTAAGGDAA